MAGLLSAFTSSAAPAGVQPSAPAVFGLQQGSTIVAAVTGLLFLGEFKGSGERVRSLLVGTLILLAAGIGVVAVAPLYMK